MSFKIDGSTLPVTIVENNMPGHVTQMPAPDCAKGAILVFPLTVQTAFCRFSHCLHFSCRPRCALVWGMVVRGFARRDLC